MKSASKALDGSTHRDCRLSKTPRTIMWSPHDDLAPYISGYHLYAVDEPHGTPHRGAFEPAWASLRIAVTDGSEWKVRPAKGDWIAPPPVSLFGPSSSVIWSESGAGILIGAGIRPRGWLRLFTCPAREFADRIDQSPMLGSLTPEFVRERFRTLSEDDAVPALFDALFRSVLRPPSADDEAIARIEAALVDSRIDTVADLARITAVHVRRLERLALRAFGFPPKLLLRRARFLRSLHAMRAAGRGEGATAIDAAYTDYSHFIRDSHDFLGMSPQAFLEINMPLLKRSLELRKAVLGAPAQALDLVPGVESAGQRRPA